MAPLAERVAAGAALLDRVLPGWWQARRSGRRVNLTGLDLGSYESCVLGQLWGDFGAGVDVLVRARIAQDPLHSRRMDAYGFALPWDPDEYEGPSNEYITRVASWGALTAAWKALVRGRRATARAKPVQG